MTRYHYRFPARFMLLLSGTDVYQAVDMGNPVPIIDGRFDPAAASAVRKLLDGSWHADESVHVHVQLTESEKDALRDIADTLDMCARDQLNDPTARMEGMADIRAAKATHRTLSKDNWRG